MENINVRELKGIRSLKCLNVFHRVLLGLKLTPHYSTIPYPQFFEAFKFCDEQTKNHMLREAVSLVDLEHDEIEALLAFTEDSNKVAITAANIKNLGPDEIFNRVLAVLFEVGKIKVDLVTESEKERIKEFSVDARSVLSKHPDMPLADGINIAFYEALKNVY